MTFFQNNKAFSYNLKNTPFYHFQITAILQTVKPVILFTIHTQLKKITVKTASHITNLKFTQA
ncbi:hypothetical protein BKM63_22240 [Flavobacterium johnsoniae]|uniref:Uncharacterized protein n=1 Tax=Flavobacterium johnsoniae TaxID=986 RepID=A0A1J7C1I2_FLAJO|nr:hypothetical protein BKM63_22240 [Flavobacterium johnsoniae]